MIKIISAFFLSILAFNYSSAQVSGTMVAPDSTVIMSVARVNGEIFIEMDFTKDFKFEKVAIERKPDFDPSFSQCRLIQFADVQKNDGHIVKKDNYPYHNSADVSYRVKVIFPDGGERIYPAVLLPASGH